ncbi:MAG TPA: FecR domain-containing protein [Candidatus Acidoferrales bacterium]|nr:FecR domain-containing protein [Candidatus Acidoferrales bacterium]
MNEQYLWDGSGEPDPEVRRLETLLGTFRHRGGALEFPATIILPSRRASYWRAWTLSLAAAAAVAIFAALWLVPRFFPDPRWQIVSIEGAAKIDDSAAQSRTRLAAGKRIETGDASHLTLRVDGLGRVDVGPNSRMYLLETSRIREEAVLERGTIHAQVTAPPYVFLVRTPAAYALDMGCAYTLHVNPDGSGVLEVTEGWIQFQHGWVQSMVPAGASAEMLPGYGPGAPYFSDASEKFRDALRIVNFDFNDPAARSAALSVVMVEARKGDAFTLLNLLRRVAQEDRGRLYDRLVEFLPPTPGLTRDDAINGNWNAFNGMWDELGIGHPKKGVKGPPHIEE